MQTIRLHVLPDGHAPVCVIGEVYGTSCAVGGHVLRFSSPPAEIDVVVGQDVRVAGFVTVFGILPHALSSSSILRFCSSTLRTGFVLRPSTTSAVFAGISFVFFMPFPRSTPFALPFLRALPLVVGRFEIGGSRAFSSLALIAFVFADVRVSLVVVTLGFFFGTTAPADLPPLER